MSCGMLFNRGECKGGGGCTGERLARKVGGGRWWVQAQRANMPIASTEFGALANNLRQMPDVNGDPVSRLSRCLTGGAADRSHSALETIMLLTNLISRTLSQRASANDLAVLDVLANPRRCCDRSPISGSVRYFRGEHSDLLVHYPNYYTRRYWWWIFWRASV